MFRGQNGPVNVVQWSPSGKYIAFQDILNMHIWDVNNQKMLGVFNMPQDVYFVGMGWQSNSKQIAVAFAIALSREATIYLFDVQTGKVATVYSDKFYPSRMAWSADGRLRAEGENSKSIAIYSADSNRGDPIHLYGASKDLAYSESEYILELSWSPDNKYIASGDSLGFVRVWEVASGKITWVYQYVHGYVSALAWSPSGEYLASAYGSGSQFLVWDVRTGKPVYDYD